MNADDWLAVFHCGGNECLTAPVSSEYRLAKSARVVWKDQPFWGVAEVDVLKAFLEQCQAPNLLGSAGCLIAERQFVAKECDSGTRRAAEVIFDIARHDHLGGKVYLPVYRRIAVPEQVSRVTGSFAVYSPDFLSRVEQGAISEQTEEVDRVEHIRLSGPVLAGDAGKSTEIDLHVYEVLEPVDLESSKHDAPSPDQPGT
jgi:hypothetical protein